MFDYKITFHVDVVATIEPQSVGFPFLLSFENRKMPYWLLAGVSYMNAMWFVLKYISFFGISSNAAKFDGFNPPHTPMCGSLIYRNADMWR